MRNSGFTLIEVLVVASITVLITSFLIGNFSQARLGLDRAMNVMVADIRDTQSKAVTSAKFNGSLRCGYGIHYLSATSYRVFTSAAASGACATDDRKYNSPGDPTVRDVAIDTSVNFQAAFTDIFFEPPDPITYINGVTNGVSTIVIQRIGATGGDIRDFRVICVYASGRIDTAIGMLCP